MWKRVLEAVKYTDWHDDEIKTIVEETGASEDISSDVLENCDGIVLTNVNEKASNEEIKKLLKDAKEIDKIKIETSGNAKSRIVTGIPKKDIIPLGRKLDGREVDGTIIHCKPHVPATQPKDPVKDTDNSNKPKEAASVAGKSDAIVYASRVIWIL